MNKTKKRIYIAPGTTSRIFGGVIIAKEIILKNDTLLNPCYFCYLERLKICENKFSETRPACFGNDPENLSKKPLFYKSYEK